MISTSTPKSPGRPRISITRPAGARPPSGKRVISTFTTAPSSSGRRTRLAAAVRRLESRQVSAAIRASVHRPAESDFLRDARVVGQHVISVRAVAKKADDRRVLALDDLHDAAFGAAVGTAPLDAREHAVAVHGVAQIVAADEEIAFDARDRLIRDDEAVAIAMRDDAARNQIRIARRVVPVRSDLASTRLAAPRLRCAFASRDRTA